MEQTESVQAERTCQACGDRIGPRAYRVTWRLRTEERVTALHYCSQTCFAAAAPHAGSGRARGVFEEE